MAVVASILAIIISPSNLIGLPIGIWALVVLSQREVRAAFARNRKRATGSASVAPPNDTEHSDTLPRSTGRSGTQGGMVALVLCLAAIPLALLIGSFVPLHPAFVFGLLLLLGIITLILGIARWESGMGKAAVIMSSILTVIALWVLGVAISGVTLLVPARRIEVPVGSTAHVGADGQVEVDLPGRAKAAATAAVPDETAIQGTWEIANSTSTYMHALWTDPAVREREEEVRKTTKIVIASDILKVTGEFLPVAIYEYQLGTRGNHKIIDLRIGSRNYHGIYKLERDQLTMCVTAFAQRPSEFFAEFGSQTESAGAKTHWRCCCCRR